MAPNADVVCPGRPRNGDLTTIDMLVAIVSDAEQWADDLQRVLAVWEVAVPGWPGRPLTAPVLYKIGALTRLRRLEQSGLAQFLPSLPASEAVLADLPATGTPEERFP